MGEFGGELTTVGGVMGAGVPSRPVPPAIEVGGKMNLACSRDFDIEFGESLNCCFRMESAVRFGGLWLPLSSAWCDPDRRGGGTGTPAD